MTQNNSAMILDLPAQLDAGKTSALVAEMRKLPHAAEIRLNAAAVTDVPLSYLQLLLSTFKTFANASVSDASAEFADAFAGYGLTYPVSAAAQPATEQALAPSEVQPAVETASASSEVQPAIETALALKCRQQCRPGNRNGFGFVGGAARNRNRISSVRGASFGGGAARTRNGSGWGGVERTNKW